jgi:hypothetical protein
VAEPLTRRPRYGGRFALAYFVLAVVVGAAVGSAVVFAGRSESHADRQWSRWRPTGDDATRTLQIAQHVSRRYRLASGRQRLVNVVPGPPTTNAVVSAIAVQALGAGLGSASSVFDASRSRMYLLCGSGRNCSLGNGPATLQRGRLLRGEALELALYTFKYVGGVDSVVTFLPGRPGTRPTFALFFLRESLAPLLDRPLQATLPPARTLVPSALPERMARVDRLTVAHLFRFQVRESQDGNAAVVLTPLALGS